LNGEQSAIGANVAELIKRWSFVRNGSIDKELEYGRRIIMLYFCHILQCELFFETGANEKTRIIDVRCITRDVLLDETSYIILIIRVPFR
jgi:hypothetical protein